MTADAGVTLATPSGDLESKEDPDGQDKEEVRLDGSTQSSDADGSDSMKNEDADFDPNSELQEFDDERVGYRRSLRVFSWHGLDLSVDHPHTDFKIAFYLSIKILLKGKNLLRKF